MSDNENIILEDLKKLKEQFKQDLADLQGEENVVKLAVSNPEHIRLIQTLQDRTKIPKHSKTLLKNQNQKIADRTRIIDEKKLIDYYRTLTGVTVNKISLKTLPLEDDPTDNCCYLYEVNANIENLQFYITYCTNKPPDELTQSKEVIKQLKITLPKPASQIEIQDGLDFFAENTCISSAILFLKSVNKLNTIRRNIVKQLLAKHKKYLNIAIIELTGQLCMICKGIVHENNYFILYWQVKWDHKVHHSARDSFQVKIEFADKQLVDDSKHIFEDICSYEKFSNFTERQKLHLFVNIINLLVEAETRNIADDSFITSTEYSSVS